MNEAKCEDLRDVLKLKAEKHSLFYRSYSATSNSCSKDLLAIADSTQNKSPLFSEEENQNLDYEFNTNKNRAEEDGSMHDTNKIALDTKIQNFEKLIEMSAKKSLSPDVCLDVNVNANKNNLKNFNINIDERDGCYKDLSTNDLTSNNNNRRVTLTVTDIPLRPALLPLAEPTSLSICESPTKRFPTSDSNNSLNNSVTPEPIDPFCSSIRSKMILEEQVIPIPNNDLIMKLKNANNFNTNYDEKEISLPRVQIKYVRTPSVVVSDYSDDVMYGITLEEIEYLRNKNNYRRCSYDDAYSDVSASSSCSNLNYCCESIGNSYDNLFDELPTPERKISNGSQTSTISNEDIIISGLEELKPQPKKKVSH